MGILIPRPKQGYDIALLPGDADLAQAGTVTFTDLGNGVMRVVIPAGGPMTNISSVDGIAWWDTGFTVDELLDIYAGVRLTHVDVEAGTGGDGVLALALAYGPTTPTTSSDLVWAMLNYGQALNDNTSCNFISRKSGNAIVPGTAISAFTYADLQHRLHSVGDTRQTFIVHSHGSNRDLSLTTDAKAMTGTDKVWVGLGAGRSATEAATFTVDVRIDFLPPGAN